MQTNKSVQLDKPDYRGKVRDIYDLGDTLVIVASDRLSAFDVIFKEPIPDKGKILTQISNKWFSLMDFIPNHILETNVDKFPQEFRTEKAKLEGRSVWVKKAKRIDFECVVRGYMMGSGYKEYKEIGSIAGISIPGGLKQGDRLPEPIFTPAIKAASGHDENVDYNHVKNQIGEELASRLRDASIKIYQYAYEKLYKNGLILADTKFEFGMIGDELILIDEVLTPDSSRFFELENYESARKKGELPSSMDKQVVRDYLESTGWDKNPPPPPLPHDIIEETRRRYAKIGDIIAILR